MQEIRNTFPKAERICSKLELDSLFAGKSRSMVSFPIRAVYLAVERKEREPAVKIMISVPKRCFKHAVKRNRVKRQIREAYRKNKHELMATVPEDTTLLVSFIWLDPTLHPSDEVEAKVVKLLHRIQEKL